MTLSMALAQRILEIIQESGASQVESIAALGVVGSLLPTLNIPAIQEEVPS